MGKIQWNIIIRERRFLQSPKDGRYYLCRLQACKKSCKDFKIKMLFEYHDWYVQSDILLLADILSNFRNMCFEIYGIDRAYFLSAQGLTCLKKERSKIRSIKRYRYVIDGRKSYERWNVSCYSSVCES